MTTILGLYRLVGCRRVVVRILRVQLLEGSAEGKGGDRCGWQVLGPSNTSGAPGGIPLAQYLQCYWPQYFSGSYSNLTNTEGEKKKTSQVTENGCFRVQKKWVFGRQNKKMDTTFCRQLYQWWIRHLFHMNIAIG